MTHQVVLRDGSWQGDNGNCRNTIPVAYFEGFGPKRTANCRPNEVEVPSVIGKTFAEAAARLSLQPLTPVVVYKPAVPGQPLGVVVGQIPRSGRLSSYEKVTLVFAKALHGIVPKLVGLPVSEARRRLVRLKLRPFVRGIGDTVIAQRPKWNVAAGVGLRITLWVKPGSDSARSPARNATGAP